MTDVQALIALRDAVREGRLSGDPSCREMVESAVGREWLNVGLAYSDSTDAAFALFGVLLPGWRMDALWQGGVMARTQEVWNCRLRTVNGLRVVCTDERKGYDTPARAWLLAILEAKIQEATPCAS